MLDNTEGKSFQDSATENGDFCGWSTPFEAIYSKLLKIEQNGEQYETFETPFYKNSSVTILNEIKRLLAIFKVHLPPFKDVSVVGLTLQGRLFQTDGAA